MTTQPSTRAEPAITTDGSGDGHRRTAEREEPDRDDEQHTEAVRAPKITATSCQGAAQ
jgi:hypothetical protein